MIIFLSSIVLFIIAYFGYLAYEYKKVSKRLIPIDRF